MHKPFSTLSQRRQVRRMTFMARKALEAYAVPVTSVKPLKQVYNKNFRITTQNSEQYLLRIYHPRRTSVEMVRSELLWFAALSQDTDLIALPLLGGIFPVLLLVANRRKGDFVPGLVLRLLGNPIVLVGTYLLFVGGIFVYGLFIFEGIVERVATLLVGVGVLAMTVVMLRRGALARRVVVELREDQTLGGTSVISLTSNGKPATAQVCMVGADGQSQVRAATGEVPIPDTLRSASVQLPATETSELKAWVHKLTPEWRSESLPALLSVRCGGEVKEFDLALRGGQIILPTTGEACDLEITMAEPFMI